LRHETKAMKDEQEHQLEEDHNGEVWYSKTLDDKNMKVQEINNEKQVLEHKTREEQTQLEQKVKSIQDDYEAKIREKDEL